MKVDRTFLMAQVSSSEKIIRRLYEITNNYDLGFKVQIEQLLEMGLERFNLDIAILSKIENERYIVQYCVTPDEVELSPGNEFELQNTYCHITCQSDAPTAFEHVAKHEEHACHPAYKAFGLESYIGVPIKIAGKLYGTLNFSSAMPYQRKFKEVDIDALQLMTSWIQTELVRREQEQRLIELNHALSKKAYEDSLTGIPNRRAMYKHLIVDLNRVGRESNSAVLALIDIDFFKNINDTYGHQEGDKILIKVAQSLNSNKRDYDFLARIGGEEFLLWLPNIDLEVATKVCQRMKKAIANLPLGNKKGITVSVGLTCHNIHPAQKVDNREKLYQLITEADKALYDAKSSGRNCIKVFHDITQPHVASV